MNDQDDTDGESDDAAVTAAIAAVAPTLRDPAVWSEPPPWLAESIVAAIEAEYEAEPEGESVGPARRPPPAAPSRRPTGRWLVLAAAAAVMALLVGIVVSRGGDSGEERLAIASTDVFPDAAATAEVIDLTAGVAIRLDVEGLPPAPEGQYYAGWVRSAEGELVGIGSFHMRGGDATVTLWSGVPIEDYPTLSVTIQTEGEGEASSGEAVLRGSLVAE